MPRRRGRRKRENSIIWGMEMAHRFPTQIPPMDPYTPNKSQRLCLGDEVYSQLHPASSPCPLLWDIFPYHCFPCCSRPSHSDLLTISPECRLRDSTPASTFPPQTSKWLLYSPVSMLSAPASLPFTLHDTLPYPLHSNFSPRAPM